MGIDEQKEEREVLDSIFPDEIQDISETEYRISITLDVASDDDDSESRPPTLILQVRYPDAYPDEAPYLDLSTPPNAPKHPHLDLQSDKPRLLSALQPSIDENLGIAMIFTLVSTLKDSAELLITERRDAIAAQREVESRAAEAEENRKFQGTQVTRDRFLEWRERFRGEVREEEERRRREESEVEEKRRKGKGAGGEEKRLTGRQLWERGLVGKGEEDEVEEGQDALAGMEGLKVGGE
ncbi:RWD-domain-containing protein [Viridothelium virens]|uniref:RWD-domain-containing protein n=1 Tax=Viridothelium virens TaxID=1048519 RepID=A0A6A6HA49_VIRVR|nr:RWD-domain-containing protein [Viridothelium virens]